MKLTLCKMEACLKNDSSLRCKPCFRGMKAGMVLLLQMRRQHQREQVARVGVKVSPTGLAVEKCCGTIPVVCPPYNLRGMLVGREPSGKPPPSKCLCSEAALSNQALELPLHSHPRGGCNQGTAGWPWAPWHASKALALPVQECPGGFVPGSSAACL